jgi:hypothetical protein
MGPSGFTSHPKEGVLRIFIDLKNQSPWPGSNPQPLVPVANTPTTTPPSVATLTFCINFAVNFKKKLQYELKDEVLSYLSICGSS